MLVLSRTQNQTVMIGDDVEVTVVDVRGDRVRLGIAAPRTVSVHRKEVYESIQRENRAAAQLQPEDLASGAAARPVRTISPRITPPSPVAKIHRDDQRDAFLNAAIEQAKAGEAEGGIPIGAVLVRNGLIVARGRNQRVQRGDPMAHAEIDCLKNAGRQKTWRDTVLYSTLMPCHLCAGAILQFGIPKVVVGESVNFPGAADLLRQQGVEVVDLHDATCIDLLGRFIEAQPALWNEDIGK